MYASFTRCAYDSAVFHGELDYLASGALRLLSIQVQDKNSSLGKISAIYRVCAFLTHALFHRPPNTALVELIVIMAPHKQSHQTVNHSSHSEVNRLFPHSENFIVRNSSFFQKPHPPPSLPSQAEVREIAKQTADSHAYNVARPPPVRFPSMGLLVKYGSEVTIAEAQCLLFIRSQLSQTVPVPEIFGWCKNNSQVFIYMELMDGITLEKRWETMVEDDRLAICQQLRHMIDAWRGLKNGHAPPFIGEPTPLYNTTCGYLYIATDVSVDLSFTDYVFRAH